MLNPKSESRNPKQIQMSQIEMHQTAMDSRKGSDVFYDTVRQVWSLRASGFEFVSYFEIRISDFTSL